MSTPFLFTYRMILAPVAHGAMRIGGLFNEKISKGLDLRKNQPWLKLPSQSRPLWFHCASGEFEYAKPVLREIKRQFPDEKILVTYFSPSIEKSVSQHPDIDMSCPSPWENKKSMTEFLEHLQPKALLVARTDTWPEMLAQAKKFNIPSLMFSSTLVKSSQRMKGLGGWITQHALQGLDEIYTVTAEDQQNFIKLGYKKAKVAGDTRFDQVLYRKHHPKKLKEELRPGGNDITLVAGSTWEADEEVLLKLWSQNKDQTWPRLLLAPHEPTDKHLHFLEEKIQGLGLKSIRYTQASQWEDGEILLIDTIGILADLYAWGQFAFVGGSFKGSVHSVMEPLAHGAATFVGPYFQNNREAIEFSQKSLNGDLHMVHSVDSVNDFQLALSNALSDPNQLAQYQKKISSAIKSKSGASQRVVAWIKEHRNKN